MPVHSRELQIEQHERRKLGDIPLGPLPATEKIVERFDPVFRDDDVVGDVRFFESAQRQQHVVGIVFDQ